MKNLIMHLIIGLLFASCNGNNSAIIQSEKGNWELAVSTNEWHKVSSKVLADSDFELKHASNNAYLFAVSQTDSIDKAMLEFAAVEKFNEALTNGKLLLKTEEKINNNLFLRVAFEGEESGKQVVYDGVFFTGKQGTIQIIIRSDKQFYTQHPELINQTFRNIHLK